MINIPKTPYTRISWEDRLERTSRDYGVPEKPYDGVLMTPEEEAEWYEAHLQEDIAY